MVSSQGAWRTESRAGAQTAASLGLLGVGVGLAWAFRHAAPGFGQERAAFLLGALLALVGAGLFVFGVTQAVVVDAGRRRIVVERRTRFERTDLEIPFTDIDALSVEEQGDREGGSVRYFVAARLRSGRQVPLFLGFYEGAHSKAAMEDRRQRIADSLSAAA